MRPVLAFAALLFAPLGLGTAVAAQADPILASILADSAKSSPVAFERTVTAEKPSADKPASVVVDRFNPRGAAGAQWTLVSIDGRGPTKKETEAHKKATAALPVPGFHRLSRWFAEPPARRTESQGRITYRWDGLPDGAFMTPGGDISSHLSAEMLVEKAGSKPQVSTVRVFAAKPFTIRSVAKMNRFDTLSQFRPLPGGQSFLASQAQSVDVTAPFGMGSKQKTQVSFKAL